MQTFPRGTSTLTLPAGDNRAFDLRGNFVRVLDASGSFLLGFDDDGEAALVEPGLAVYLDAGKDFRSIRLTNPGASDVSGIRLAVGYGRYDDNRLQYSGAVSVRGGGSGFTDVAVSIGAAAALLLAADPDRTSGVIRAGASDLWLGPDATVTATGPATIPAGGSLTIGHRAAVWGIRAGAAVEAGVYAEVA